MKTVRVNKKGLKVRRRNKGNGNNGRDGCCPAVEGAVIGQNLEFDMMASVKGHLNPVRCGSRFFGLRVH